MPHELTSPKGILRGSIVVRDGKTGEIKSSIPFEREMNLSVREGQTPRIKQRAKESGKGTDSEQEESK